MLVLFSSGASPPVLVRSRLWTIIVPEIHTMPATIQQLAH